MDVIDAQVHLGPGQIDTTVGAMDALGIRGVVIDEFWGRQPYGDPRFFEPGFALGNGAWRSLSPTAELASMLHPERFTSVVRVDRRDPDLSSVVRRVRDTPYSRALRALPTWTAEEVSAFRSGAYEELFGLAQEAGLPVFVHVPGYVELLPRYLEQFPQLSLIVDHCGMAQPGLSMGRSDSEQERVESPHYFTEVLRLADFPNVALKWSHEQIGFGATEYPFPGTRPHLREAVDAFGAERILWASDKSVLPFTWSDILHAVRDDPGLSADERALVMGGTTRRLLDWYPDPA